jgi:hypothetical protein
MESSVRLRPLASYAKQANGREWGTLLRRSHGVYGHLMPGDDGRAADSTQKRIAAAMARARKQPVN